LISARGLAVEDDSIDCMYIVVSSMSSEAVTIAVAHRASSNWKALMFDAVVVPQEFQLSRSKRSLSLSYMTKRNLYKAD